MRNINLFFTIAIVSAFLMSCKPVLAPETLIPSSDSNKSTEKPSKSVCFAKSCVAVVPQSKIIDPHGEFKYPDPARFPAPSQRDYYRRPTGFMDLKNTNAKLRISQDFFLDDFASADKGRYALISTAMINRVQNIKDRLGSGLRVSSGYRSPAYNRKIEGSATWSRHTYGDGVDLIGKPIRRIRDACIVNKATFYLTYRDGHVHCDWRAAPLETAFYSTSRYSLAPAAMTAMNLTDVQAAYSSLSQIRVEKIATSINIKVLLPDLELESEPDYQWTLTSPSGQISTYETPELNLNSLQEAGTYLVKVEVGGFINSETQFEHDAED